MWIEVANAIMAGILILYKPKEEETWADSGN